MRGVLTSATAGSSKASMAPVTASLAPKMSSDGMVGQSSGAAAAELTRAA